MSRDPVQWTDSIADLREATPLLFQTRELKAMWAVAERLERVVELLRDIDTSCDRIDHHTGRLP